MAIPRRCTVDPDRPGVYHTYSRCVRRAFLLQEGHVDRRAWLEAQLHRVLEFFAFDLHAFAFLGNHFHLVVANDPQRARRWTPREVARRWLELFPARWIRRKRGVAADAPPTDEEIDQLVNEPGRIEVLRRRLHNLSWLLKTLKEPIARRANREDGVTGHFWEGRFGSSALLDDAAIVAVCAYVDLNEVRAGCAQTPETSICSSTRVRAQTLGKVGRGDAESPSRHFTLAPVPGLDDEDYLAMLNAESRDVDSGRSARSGRSDRARSASRSRVLGRGDGASVAWRRRLEEAIAEGRIPIGRGHVAGTPTSVSTAASTRGRRWLWNALSVLWAAVGRGEAGGPSSRAAGSDQVR